MVDAHIHVVPPNLPGVGPLSPGLRASPEKVHALPSGSDALPVTATVAVDGEVKRLERSRHKADFFRLANHFESQSTLPACGPTTGGAGTPRR